MTVHITLVAGNNGPDLATWISASAAAVQAIGAVAAIVYSGKLARDAADREKAADVANVRRIDEANSAAEKQRQLDREQADAREAARVVEEFNAPLVRATELGDGALAELRIAHEDFRRMTVEGEQSHFSGEVGRLQTLALDQLPPLVSAAGSARAAVAVRDLLVALRFPGGLAIMQAPSWVERYEQAIPKVESAMNHIKHEMR